MGVPHCYVNMCVYKWGCASVCICVFLLTYVVSVRSSRNDLRVDVSQNQAKKFKIYKKIRQRIEIEEEYKSIQYRKTKSKTTSKKEMNEKKDRTFKNRTWGIIGVGRGKITWVKFYVVLLITFCFHRIPIDHDWRVVLRITSFWLWATRVLVSQWKFRFKQRIVVEKWKVTNSNVALTAWFDHHWSDVPQCHHWYPFIHHTTPQQTEPIQRTAVLQKIPSSPPTLNDRVAQVQSSAQQWRQYIKTSR